MTAKRNLVLTALSVGLATSASAGTLLVDFGGNDNGGILASTAADFAGQDANVDLAANVNVFNADNNAGDPAPIVAVSGIDITANVQLLNGTSGFNANTGAGSGTNNVPILDGYAVLRGGDGARISVTGLDEIAAGAEVTLTVYALGDQTNQVGDVGLTLAGGAETLIAGGDTSATGTVSGDDPLGPVIGADSFRQTTFTKVDGVDSFEIRIDRDSFFSAINGFSLTVVPEPASLGLVGLGALAICGRRRRA